MRFGVRRFFQVLRIWKSYSLQARLKSLHSIARAEITQYGRSLTQTYFAKYTFHGNGGDLYGVCWGAEILPVLQAKWKRLIWIQVQLGPESLHPIFCWSFNRCSGGGVSCWGAAIFQVWQYEKGTVYKQDWNRRTLSLMQNSHSTPYGCFLIQNIVSQYTNL